MDAGHKRASEGRFVVSGPLDRGWVGTALHVAVDESQNLVNLEAL